MVDDLEIITYKEVKDQRSPQNEFGFFNLKLEFGADKGWILKIVRPCGN